jgi:hypothetical protein
VFVRINSEHITTYPVKLDAMFPETFKDYIYSDNAKAASNCTKAILHNLSCEDSSSELHSRTKTCQNTRFRTQERYGNGDDHHQYPGGILAFTVLNTLCSYIVFRHVALNDCTSEEMNWSNARHQSFSCIGGGLVFGPDGKEVLMDGPALCHMWVMNRHSL